MIDVVAGYAYGYDEKQIRPFLKSLRGSGYAGRIVLFANGGAVKEAQKWDVQILPCPPVWVKPHSARFICLKDLLSTLHCEGVLLADTRDVIFQADVSLDLPSEGLHVFEEADCMTIGTCPYNSDWIRLGYGNEVLQALSDFPISCVGTVCGDYVSVMTYLELLVKEIKQLQPRTQKPQDQAAHNYLVRNTLKPTIWHNEVGEVYTVGYLPRESVRVKGDMIMSASGWVPAVIHQWDRHQNLSALIEGLYGK